MTVLLVFLAIQADTVQTPGGAKHQIDGKQLAVIYHERAHRSLKDRLRRRKRSLLISNPTCSFYYTETIHLLRVLLERQHEKKGQSALPDLELRRERGQIDHRRQPCPSRWHRSMSACSCSTPTSASPRRG